MLNFQPFYYILLWLVIFYDCNIQATMVTQIHMQQIYHYKHHEPIQWFKKSTFTKCTKR